ncbi:DNA repair protein RecO [Mucilaginibacter koreensis]
MLHKTRGIVFKVTDYGETSVIVQVFTEKFGLQSYIINGVKRPKAKITRNMLQPLHLLDLVVYYKNTGSVQRIKELKNVPLLQTIPYDVIKSGIALFLNEVLYKAVKQQTPDEQLFEYIYNSVELLDHVDKGLANFHLLFLIGLTRYLGFYPDSTNAEESDYFDMKNGVFTRYKPDTTLYLSPPYTHIFYELMQYGFDDMDQLKISNDERRTLIIRILEFFAQHIEGFGNIHAHEILEEVLS